MSRIEDQIFKYRNVEIEETEDIYNTNIYTFDNVTLLKDISPDFKKGATFESAIVDYKDSTITFYNEGNTEYIFYIQVNLIQGPTQKILEYLEEEKEVITFPAKRKKRRK